MALHRPRYDAMYNSAVYAVKKCLSVRLSHTWYCIEMATYIKSSTMMMMMMILMIPGLFIPLHFRSKERKVHRENFRSRGTFVPWNIRSLELSLLWNFHSSGAKVLRTFVPWNIRSRGTFVPWERRFQELSFL